MKRIIALFLVLSLSVTLFCALTIDAATIPIEELYLDFDGTEDYESWCGIGTKPLIENGMYRLVTDKTTATDGFVLPNTENFTIEARIRYSNTAPRLHLYTKNNGVFIHMLYDGIYVENGKERLYSDTVEIGKEWHDWKYRFFNDGNNFEIYLDGNLILDGETEHNGGTHPGSERYTIYKVADEGEIYGIFEMDWRRYTPGTSLDVGGLDLNLITDKTEYVEGEDINIETDLIGEGVDNIYELSTDGNWTLYSRQVGSDGDWIKITSGTTAAHTNNKTLKINCGLGVSSAVAYTKRSSGDMAYASGDTVLASFYANKSTDLSKASVSVDANGNTGVIKTFDCLGETYAYASGGWMDIPFCPRYSSTWGGKVYVQIRTHALTSVSNDKHIYIYYANTHRIAKNVNHDLYQAAGSNISLLPDGISVPEINYTIDGEVVAVGKRENGYKATISGLKPGIYSIRAEYGGSASKTHTVKVVPAVSGELKVSKTSETNVEASLELSDKNSVVKSVDFFVDGELIATKNSKPFNASLTIVQGSSHTVSAIAREESGIIAGKYHAPIYPSLSGNNTTTNYSNEIRYTVSGGSGSSTVNVSNGTYKLQLEHTKDGFTYLTDKGEKEFKCGTGSFIVVTDAYAADVYYKGMLVVSFTMPMTNDVVKKITNNGLIITNFGVTVPEERVTYFSRANVKDAETYTEVPYIPYSHVADMVMNRNQNVRFYIKDGYFRSDLKVENGKVYAITKLRKAYLNELGSYFEDAAPVWRMLGELPDVNGDVHIRVETVGGISRIYANDQQIGVFRGIVIAGGTGVAFDVENGSEIKKFTISDASDVYYYEDEFNGSGSFSTADFWRSEGGTFTVAEKSGKITLDTTNAESGWATINVAASKAEVSADIQIANADGGFWYIFGKQDTAGGFVGYNFETSKFEIGETVSGKTVKIAEADGTLPVGSPANWKIITKRDKTTDRELVELFINGEKVVSGYSTCHNNANIGFASSGNSADILNIKYRGNSKPVMGMIEYTEFDHYLTRGFMTDEGTYFVGEGTTGYLFTNDGGKTFENVSYDAGGVTLFDSFVWLDNGDLLGIDHGIFHPVSIAGGKAYQQHTYISKDKGKTWTFNSVIRPEKPYSTGMENRAYKTSTGRIINACGDEYGVNGWTAEDYGAETIYYSDDNGKTWKTSDIVRSKEIGMVLGESIALELEDGTIRLFFRTGSGAINYIDSHDNGTSFDFSFVGTTPFETNVNCFNITKDPMDPKTLWATWGYDWGNEGSPHSQWPRERFAVAVSYDEGTTWEYVGTLKDSNYFYEKYGASTGNFMNAGIFVDDKAVYVKFMGSENYATEENFIQYQYVIDKSKIVPTKSWEKLHLKDEFSDIGGVLEHVISKEKADKTMLVGTATDNLFMNKEFYTNAAYNGNIQAEFAASFAGADVSIDGNSVVFSKSGTQIALQGIKANDKTYVSAEEFAEKLDYKLYEKDGYNILSKSVGWRDTQDEVTLYTVGDYVEPPLYDAVAKKDAWRAYLKELEDAEIAKKDYADGDYIVSSFDADNEEDMKQVTSSDGTTVNTAEFGDGKYAYATQGKWLMIPQICPTIVSGTSVYVKFRIHAIDNDTLGKVVYMYTRNSGNARASRTLNNASIGENRLLANSESGVDVIFELKTVGHTNYVRTAGSDEPWTVLETDKTYSNNNAFQALMVQYGLGVSKAMIYKKVDDATAAFNAASKNNDASAMRSALNKYATNYGIDLNKLDEVENEDLFYSKLFNLNFEKASEVATAFDAAVTAAVNDTFTIDYVVGDKLLGSFDADNPEDMAQLSSSEGEVLTKTYAGETYAYTSRVSTATFLKVPQIVPTLSSNEAVYVKMRLHAAFDNTTGKTVYVWTKNSGNVRAGFNMLENVSNRANSCADSVPGIDVILEMKPDGFNLYSKKADSDEWTLDYENKEYQIRTGELALYVYYGLAVSEAKVYVKRTPASVTLKKTGSTAEKWFFEVSTEAEITSGTVYVCAYDGNDVMLGAALENYNTDGATSVELPIPATGEVSYFKAFVWDDNQTPVARMKKLDNK